MKAVLQEKTLRSTEGIQTNVQFIIQWVNSRALWLRENAGDNGVCALEQARKGLPNLLGEFHNMPTTK